MSSCSRPFELWIRCASPRDKKRARVAALLAYFPFYLPPLRFSDSKTATSLTSAMAGPSENNTCKKATVAMQQKLQTTVFSTITLCQPTTTEANAHKQRQATWNALRGGALRPPPAPLTSSFLMVGPPLLLQVARARQQHH